LATDVESHYNPISRKSERAGIVEINSETSTVCMHVPGAGVRPFHYTAVHKGEASQQSVYEKSAQEAVTAVLNGFNACLMCYGQTGKKMLACALDSNLMTLLSRLLTAQGLVRRTHFSVRRRLSFLVTSGYSRNRAWCCGPARSCWMLETEWPSPALRWS
jgi:hypothetical protein